MSLPTTTRREFLRSAAAAATLITPYYLSGHNARAGEPRSKNDRPLIGAIGLGGRGLGDTRTAARFGDVVAVCDLDRTHAERAKETFGGKPDVYTDYRKLLQRDDIEVIINGTPDHWHTAVAIDSCKAGKDLYTEKPMTLTIDEGKLLREAVEKTGRVVQVGTQQRSDRRFQLAVDLAQNGTLGKLKQIWVALPYYTTKGGPFAPEPVPEHLDWDMYQGQAPARDYCRQRAHGTFRWWYEYAGGIITDWGNHHVDIAQWALDRNLTGPVSVDARGLFPNPGGPQYYNTPDRFFSRITYADGIEVLYFSALGDRRVYGEVDEHETTTPQQVRWLFGEDVPDQIKTFDRNGIMLIGEKGRLLVNRGGIYGKPIEELMTAAEIQQLQAVDSSVDHMRNFFDCVQSRSEPASPVRVQHRTVSVCHLTNISLRLGRKLAWDPESEKILGDAEANAWLKREKRDPYAIEG